MLSSRERNKSKQMRVKDKMKKFTKVIWRCGVLVNSWIERLSALLHIGIMVLVIFICSQAIAFCVVYLQLLSNAEINMIFFKYIDIWGIFSLESESLTSELIYSDFENVKTKIEFLMNISVALSGILLSLVTCISYFKKNVDFRRRSCFKKKEIFEVGKDDVKIMCEFFRGANFAAVYSHSFEWLKKNEEIRNILINLSKKNKLKLYTGDVIEDVKNRLEDCGGADLIESLQKTEISIRFSYIERNNAKYLLYRQEEDNHLYVIRVRENNESHYLLQVISQLVK